MTMRKVLAIQALLSTVGVPQDAVNRTPDHDPTDLPLGLRCTEAWVCGTCHDDPSNSHRVFGKPWPTIKPDAMDRLLDTMQELRDSYLYQRRRRDDLRDLVDVAASWQYADLDWDIQDGIDAACERIHPGWRDYIRRYGIYLKTNKTRRKFVAATIQRAFDTAMRLGQVTGPNTRSHFGTCALCGGLRRSIRLYEIREATYGRQRAHPDRDPPHVSGHAQGVPLLRPVRPRVGAGQGD